MPGVEILRLTKRYPGSAGDAVSGVDLAIAEGERFVILGPSGSGKTTLLRMIAGLEDPSSGDILIGGRRINDLAPRHRGVGMVFQHPALYPHLDAHANLTFGLKARGVPKAEIAARTAELAGWLGLGGLLRRKPKALSGGERQRVALGRAVLPRPAVLLLDEPFSSLDAPLRVSTRTALLDLHRRVGGTMVLVTHDQTEALAVGERVAVMRSGRVEQVGTPRELYDEPISRFVAGFLGDPPMSFLPVHFEDGRASIEGGPALATRPIGVESAWLGIRPEAVHVGPSAGGDRPRFPLDATLDRVEARGHESIAWFRLGTAMLSARVDRRFRRGAGESVPLGIDLAEARWFAMAVGEPRIA